MTVTNFSNPHFFRELFCVQSAGTANSKPCLEKKMGSWMEGKTESKKWKGEWKGKGEGKGKGQGKGKGEGKGKRNGRGKKGMGKGWAKGKGKSDGNRARENEKRTFLPLFSFPCPFSFFLPLFLFPFLFHFFLPFFYFSSQHYNLFDFIPPVMLNRISWFCDQISFMECF